MKKLRKRLFAVIGTLVCAAIMISVIFNIYFVNSQKIFREQAYAGSLKVYMQSIEDSLTDIENMLAIESQSDGNLKMIIRSSNRLEWYLALVRKKNQFETEIKKYQYLDGIFLYDSRKDLFAGTFGEKLMDLLGDMAYRYVFSSMEIYKMEVAESAILDALMDRLVRAVLYYDTDVEQDTIDRRVVSFISDNYKNAYKRQSVGRSEAEKLYLRLLLVTDYVCGMTDSFAKRLYQEMNGLI